MNGVSQRDQGAHTQWTTIVGEKFMADIFQAS
jgi:hypothetical protein